MFLQIQFTLVGILLFGVFDSAYTRAGNHDDLPIKYPGPVNIPKRTYGTTEHETDLPEECRGQNYCSVKPENYPQEEFNKMFKGKKVISTPEPVQMTLGDRNGDPEETDNCESYVSYEPLYRVKSTEDVWHTVVQAPNEDFVQRIRLETCTSSEAPCFTVLPKVPEFQVFCKQKYVAWELLVSDGKNGTKKINAQLPICCSCHYKHVNIADRFSGK